jgi:hypothetical protein
MKRFLSTAVWLLVCCGGLYVTGSAQNPTPNTTAGAVTRVVCIRIHQGRGEEFWADIRKNLKPIYEAEKAAGLLLDYGFATKSTKDNENDWDVALTLTYKNYAALDDFGAKADPITLKHYGSAAARYAANQKRGENASTVANFLIRQQTVNDWK